MEEQETRRGAEVEQAGGDEEAELEQYRAGEGTYVLGDTALLAPPDPQAMAEIMAVTLKVAADMEASRNMDVHTLNRQLEAKRDEVLSLRERLDTEVSKLHAALEEARSKNDTEVAQLKGQVAALDTELSSLKVLFETPLEHLEMNPPICMREYIGLMCERSEKMRAEREAEAERKKANDAEDKAEEERAGEDAGAAGSAELARVEGARADEDGARTRGTSSRSGKRAR